MGSTEHVEIEINEADLRKKIKQMINKKFSDAAKKIADDLTKEAENAISKFYNDYNPKYYFRYYNFVGNSYKRYYLNAHGRSFEGGVRLIRGIPEVYQHPAAEVFETTFAGFHGPPLGHNAGTPQMSPSPYELIIKKHKEIIANINDYINW